MPDDITTQRAAALYSKPFMPFNGSPGGPDSPATLRIATAAEYAVQLGIIARHLARQPDQAHVPEGPPPMPASWEAATRAVQGDKD
jgi:hypothetical protein